MNCTRAGKWRGGCEQELPGRKVVVSTLVPGGLAVNRELELEVSTSEPIDAKMQAEITGLAVAPDSRRSAISMQANRSALCSRGSAYKKPIAAPALAFTAIPRILHAVETFTRTREIQPPIHTACSSQAKAFHGHHHCSTISPGCVAGDRASALPLRSRPFTLHHTGPAREDVPHHEPGGQGPVFLSRGV